MWILSLLILALSALLRPTQARCPVGYDLRTGIRRSGRYQCWPHPVAPLGWRGGPIEEWDGTNGRPERSVQPDGVIEGRIWCGTGVVPIVVDDRRVRCESSRRSPDE